MKVSALLLQLINYSGPLFAGQFDSLKVDELVKQAKATMVSSPDSSRALGFELYAYANANDYDWGRAQGYIFVGASFHRQGGFDTAIYYFDKALEVNNTLKDSLQIGAAKLNKAMCLVSTGRYDEGAQSILESMKTLEQIMDTQPKAKNAYISCFNIMGQVYYYQSDFEKTRDYFVRYLEEATKAQDTLLIASANNNLGAVYYELGDFDKSLEHDLKGAEIHKQLNNPMGYANAMQNIAIDLMERAEYDKAEKFLKVALIWYQKVPNDKGVSEVYFNLGKLFYRTNKIDLSSKWYKLAIDLSGEINNPEVIKRSLLGLSNNYAAAGNHKMALETYKDHDIISDSLVNLSNLNKVSELEIAYETEKKERQIIFQKAAIQQSELELKRNQLVIIILFVLIALIGLTFLWFFKQQQYRRKLLLEQERTRASKEQIQAVIHSQEEERSRFAMDLHDDFGQLISALRININQKEVKEDEANNLLDAMYAALKNIAFNLMPQTLLEKGLSEAVDELCYQLNRLGEIKFKLNTFDIDETSIAPVKVSIYRIVQELLSNIIKYASANVVQVSITGLKGELNVLIEDNGDGFDPQKFFQSSGNGWRNISSRLDLMNGSIEVDSSRGRKNSSVSILIPYIKKEAKKVA
ncbi:tetratricopeptide repeat protein [Reichenbachiella sp.]|uniref:tetratricopeptide repeat-containing sensor histidine kinase n=1 Tax=Reichenbachiella sp. TaxID=2184521 RepID=UPI00329993B5